MNKYKQHQTLLHNTMLILQKEFPNGRFFQRHVGLFFTKNGAPIKINKKGMADLWGVIDGVHIEIEIKSGKARQTKDQKKWEQNCERMGIIYELVQENIQKKGYPTEGFTDKIRDRVGQCCFNTELRQSS